MKRLKPYIFSVFLILSGVLFFRMEDVRQEAYAQVLQPLEEAYEAICDMDIRDGNVQADGDIQGKEEVRGEEDVQGEDDICAAPGGREQPNAPGSADREVLEAGSGSVVSVSGNQPGADGQGNASGTETPPEEPEWYFGPAPEGYFDDALFIGDSRTVGLKEYGGLDQSTFYCTTGLTIYRMFTEPIVKVSGSKQKITVEEALGQRQFGKIYLMIGINEMGIGTVDSFIQKYQEQVDRLQELQPEAIIYLQGIMRVTTARSQKGDYINNEGIDARNDEIAKMADNKKIFYLDVNPLLCDEDGGLISSYTHDGVHLRAAYVVQWKEFLQENAAMRDGRPVGAEDDGGNKSGAGSEKSVSGGNHYTGADGDSAGDGEENTGADENNAGMQKDEWAEP